MKKETFHLKVSNWSKLTPKQRKESVKWLMQLVQHLEKISKHVADDFTGIYP